MQEIKVCFVNGYLLINLAKFSLSSEPASG